MNNLKDKTVIIYDNRQWVSLAERLAKEFGRVLYHSPWKDAFPQVRYSLIGTGLENVERINDFWDYVDEADLIIFPDLLDGDIQDHLINMGKKVWGSRRGDQLELNRSGLMKLQAKLKLPVIPFKEVKGMDALRSHIKSHKDQWIKTNCFRGDGETFKAPNYNFISLDLDNWDHQLGAWKTQQEFLCEEDTPDCVEIGFDGYCVDGQYPTKTMLGLEVKDLGYVCRMVDYKDIPEPVLKFNTAIAPYMKRWGYKNDISTEVRINKEKKGFMTDACCRIGSPPGELKQLMWTNYGEIMNEGANGNCIDPIAKDKYGVQLIIKCDWAKRNTLSVQFDEKYKDNIKLKSYMKLDDSYYVIPHEVGLAEIGSIVATGNTLEDACEKAEEVAEAVRASYIDIPFDALEKAQKELDKLKDFGYDIFK